jgi:hypothetical protein
VVGILLGAHGGPVMRDLELLPSVIGVCGRYHSVWHLPADVPLVCGIRGCGARLGAVDGENAPGYPPGAFRFMSNLKCDYARATPAGRGGEGHLRA